MAGITDSMNLAQRGLYKDLQHVAPGGTWQETLRRPPERVLGVAVDMS